MDRITEDTPTLLQHMLDTAYEVEGLIQLLINRPEAPGRLRQLLSQKLETLLREVDFSNATAHDDENPAYVITDEKDATYDLPGHRAETQQTADKPTASPPAPHTGRTPVFSINDRYLFARELFGGNMGEFERSLKEIASMETYEEAEEYYLSEWAFNPDQPSVASFLEAIGKYFKP